MKQTNHFNNPKNETFDNVNFTQQLLLSNLKPSAEGICPME
jgi:hypothetical protein